MERTIPLEATVEGEVFSRVAEAWLPGRALPPAVPGGQVEVHFEVAGVPHRKLVRAQSECWRPTSGGGDLTKAGAAAPQLAAAPATPGAPLAAEGPLGPAALLMEARRLRVPLLLQVPSDHQALVLDALRGLWGRTRPVLLHSGATAEQLLGSLRVLRGRSLGFAPGPLVAAMAEGCPVVLQGVESAPPETLHALDSVLAQLFDPSDLAIDRCSSAEPCEARRIFRLADPLLAAQSGATPDGDAAEGQLSFRCHRDFQVVVVAASEGALDPSLASYFAQPPIAADEWRALSEAASTRSAAPARQPPPGPLPEDMDPPRAAGEPRSGGAPLVRLRAHDGFFGDCSRCARDGLAAVIVGEPLSGKSSAWQLWAETQQGSRAVVAPVNQDTTFEQLLGSVVPCQGEPPFHWQDGPLGLAARQGDLLLLKNLHLMSIPELHALALLMVRPRVRNICLDGELVEVSSSFRVFATWSSEREMTPCLRDAFSCMEFRPEVLDGDVDALAARALGVALPGDGPAEALRSAGRSSVGRAARPLQRARSLLAGVGQDGRGSEVTALQAMLALEGGQDNEASIPEALEEAALRCLPASASRALGAAAARGAPGPLLEQLAALHAARAPVLLEGPAGAGKSLTARCFVGAVGARPPVTLCMSSALEPADLFGRLSPRAGCTFHFEPGELYLALTQGRILIVEELNLAGMGVLQTLSDVLANPDCVRNPHTGEVVAAREGFWLLATQNPDAFRGRTVLPSSLSARLVRLHVAGLGARQRTAALRRCLRDAGGEAQSMTARQAEQLCGLVDSMAGALDLRGRVKLCRRIRETVRLQAASLRTHEEQRALWSDMKQLVRVHLSVLSPGAGGVSCAVRCAEEPASEPRWVFELAEEDEPAAKVCLELPAHRDPVRREALAEDVAMLCDSQRLLLGQLAAALHFGEPALLVGPTSFKAHTAKLLSRMLHFEHGGAVASELHLSRATDLDTLVGGVEPHSRDSFARYCLQAVRPLLLRMGIAAPRPEAALVRDALAELRRALAAADRREDASSGRSCALTFVDDLLQQLTELTHSDGQGFPVCDRAISLHLRLGGMCLLRNLPEVQASVFEGLNSAFELEDGPVLLPQRSAAVARHPQFYVVATAHSLEQITPAVKSRFTCLHVPAGAEEALRRLLPGPATSVQPQTMREAVWLYSFLTVLRDPPASRAKRPRTLPSSKAGAAAQEVERLLARARWLLGSGTDVHHRGAAATSEPPLDPHWDQFSVCRGRTEADLWTSATCCQNTCSSTIAWHLVAAAECRSRRLPHPTPLFVGRHGIGKTLVCESVARFLGMKFRRISCSANLEVEGLFGRYASRSGGQSGGSDRCVFTFEPGVLGQDAAEAAKEGTYVLVLLDELNLLGARGMGALSAMLRCESSFVCQDVEVDLRRLIFCAAANPSQAAGMVGRRLLPESVLASLSVCHVSLDAKDMESLIIKQWANTSVKVGEGMFGEKQLLTCIRAGVLDSTVRGISRLRQMLESEEGHDEAGREQAIALALRLCMAPKEAAHPAGWRRLRRTLQAEDVLVPEELTALTGQEVRQAARTARFLLVLGPPAGGKKHLVREAASLVGKPLVHLFVTAATREADLIGEYGPVQQEGALLSFRFCEGPLSAAVRHGHWALIPNAHRVPPAVLERLNCLAEGRPRWDVGAQEPLAVHPDFRAFLTAPEPEAAAGGAAAPCFSAPFLSRCAVLRMGPTEVRWAAARTLAATVGAPALPRAALRALTLRAACRELTLPPGLRLALPAPGEADQEEARAEGAGGGGEGAPEQAEPTVKAEQAQHAVDAAGNAREEGGEAKARRTSSGLSRAFSKEQVGQEEERAEGAGGGTEGSPERPELEQAQAEQTRQAQDAAVGNRHEEGGEAKARRTSSGLSSSFSKEQAGGEEEELAEGVAGGGEGPPGRAEPTARAEQARQPQDAAGSLREEGGEAKARRTSGDFSKEQEAEEQAAGAAGGGDGPERAEPAARAEQAQQVARGAHKEGAQAEGRRSSGGLPKDFLKEQVLREQGARKAALAVATHFVAHCAAMFLQQQSPQAPHRKMLSGEASSALWRRVAAASVPPLQPAARRRRKPTVRSLAKWYATQGACDLFADTGCGQRRPSCSLVLDARPSSDSAFAGFLLRLVRTLEMHQVVTTVTGWSGGNFFSIKGSATASWGENEKRLLLHALRLADDAGSGAHAAAAALAWGAHQLDRLEGVCGEGERSVVLLLSRPVPPEVCAELSAVARLTLDPSTSLLGVHPAMDNCALWQTLDWSVGGAVEQLWDVLFSAASPGSSPANCQSRSPPASPPWLKDLPGPIPWSRFSSCVVHFELPVTIRMLEGERRARLSEEDLLQISRRLQDSAQWKWCRLEPLDQGDALYEHVRHLFDRQGLRRAQIHCVKRVHASAELEAQFESAKRGKATQDLWFGSSACDSEVIIMSPHGLDYRFAAFGKLGRGLYGAELAAYSDCCYTYTTTRRHRQLILYEGIVGNSFDVQQAADLPHDEALDWPEDEDIGKELFKPLRKSRTYSAAPKGFDSVRAAGLCQPCEATAAGEPMPGGCSCPWTPGAYQPEQYSLERGWQGGEALQRRRVASPVVCLYPHREHDCDPLGGAQPWRERRQERPEDLPPAVLALPIAIVEYTNPDSAREPPSWREWAAGKRDRRRPLSSGEEELLRELLQEQHFRERLKETLRNQCDEVLLSDRSIPPQWLRELCDELQVEPEDGPSAQCHDALREVNPVTEAPPHSSFAVAGLSRYLGASPDINVVIVGRCGHGKSTLANAFCESSDFKISDDWWSLATRVQHKDVDTWLDGHSCRLIDTVGFDLARLMDTVGSGNADTPNGLPAEQAVDFTEFADLATSGVDVFVLAIIGRRFVDEDVKTLSVFLSAAGRHALQHTIVVFTHMGLHRPIRPTLESCRQHENATLRNFANQIQGLVAVDATVSAEERSRARAEVSAEVLKLVRRNGGRKYTNPDLQEAGKRHESISAMLHQSVGPHRKWLEEQVALIGAGKKTSEEVLEEAMRAAAPTEGEGQSEGA